VGKPEGKRLVGPRRRWLGNIKMDLRLIVWGGMEWIHLAEDRDQWRTLLNTVKNLRVPVVGSRTAGGFSRRTQELHRFSVCCSHTFVLSALNLQSVCGSLMYHIMK
jgi:hypothetical protein